MRTRTIVALDGVGLLVLLAVGAGVLGRGTGGEPERPAGEAAPSVVRRSVELVLDTRPVRADEYWPTVAVVDDLADVATRLVLVMTDEAVLVRQCALDGADRPVSCAPAVLADPDDGGDQVTTLVELLATFTADGRPVDCRRTRCALQVVRDDSSATVLAAVELAFGQPARPGMLRVVEPAPVGPGGQVVVDLAGFPAGEPVTVGWCVPPGPVDRTACGAPAPTATAVAGADGRVRVALSVPDDRHGPKGGRCDARRPCSVAVVDAPRAATVAVVPIDYVGPPGPDLSPIRLATLLTLATVLGAGALALHLGRERSDAGDPFAGVDLDVPEWDAIVLGRDEEPLATS